MVKKTNSKVVDRYRDEEFLKRLGMRVKEMRVSKGYSIDRLNLEGDGLNRSSISRIERGLTDPQLSTLKRIADVIGVKLIELVSFD